MFRVCNSVEKRRSFVGLLEISNLEVEKTYCVLYGSNDLDKR